MPRDSSSMAPTMAEPLTNSEGERATVGPLSTSTSFRVRRAIFLPSWFQGNPAATPAGAGGWAAAGEAGGAAPTPGGGRGAGEAPPRRPRHRRAVTARRPGGQGPPQDEKGPVLLVGHHHAAWQPGQPLAVGPL